MQINVELSSNDSPADYDTLHDTFNDGRLLRPDLSENIALQVTTAVIKILWMESGQRKRFF